MTWKELSGGRSFAFHGSIPSATSSLVDKGARPGIVVVNSASEDIRIHQRQKMGNMTECEQGTY